MAKTNFEKYISEKLKNPEFAAGLKRESRELDLSLEIVYRRQELGLSQKQLADRVGTTQQQISRLEQPGYRGSLKTLYRVADALDLDVEVRMKRRTPGRTSPRRTR